jgi:hypothetical protein
MYFGLADEGEGTPRKLPTATQPQFPRNIADFNKFFGVPPHVDFLLVGDNEDVDMCHPGRLSLSTDCWKKYLLTIFKL